MSRKKSRNQGAEILPYDFQSKARNVHMANDFMFAKTLSMFEWENLPETIPYQELEKLLQKHGWAFLCEVPGLTNEKAKLSGLTGEEVSSDPIYAFHGGLGGLPDAYGNPTEIVISNPGLQFHATVKLSDGVLIRNDDSMMGLLSVLNKFNTMMVENDLNMMIHGYNNRIHTIFSAGDAKTARSAEVFLEKIVDGDMAIITEAPMLDGLKTHNPGKTDTIVHLIEYQQYIKASMFNEVGLSANFNMKRERLNSAEVLQNEDTVYPFVDNMMKCRLKGVQEMNEKFGLDVDIDYGSVWADKRRSRVDDVVNPTAEEATQIEAMEGEKPMDGYRHPVTLEVEKLRMEEARRVEGLEEEQKSSAPIEAANSPEKPKAAEPAEAAEHETPGGVGSHDEKVLGVDESSEEGEQDQVDEQTERESKTKEKKK